MKISDIMHGCETSNPVKKKKLKQKKWVPPLQQMLELMKKNEAANTSVSNADPSLSLTEDRSLLGDASVCGDCGHLILPENINEAQKVRIEKKWNKLKNKVSGTDYKCDSH